MQRIYIARASDDTNDITSNTYDPFHILKSENCVPLMIHHLLRIESTDNCYSNTISKIMERVGCRLHKEKCSLKLSLECITLVNTSVNPRAPQGTYGYGENLRSNPLELTQWHVEWEMILLLVLSTK